MHRRRGLSARWKLTLSYAGFLTVTGALLLAVVWIFLLRYVPDIPIANPTGFVPNQSDLLRAFIPAAVVAIVFLLALGLTAGWYLAGRMLAPLSHLTEAARLAAGGSLTHRIRLPGPHDEFRELADAFDVMLAQLESHVAEQQRFAANASHELRTPLAITQAMLEVAKQDPDRHRGEDLDRLQLVNTRAIELTEKLLLLSKAGNVSLATESVDLSLLAEEAAETLLAAAEERDVSIEVSGQPTVVWGDPVLLLQMVTNLTQNAIVHNVPAGGTVWVHTTTLQDRHTLTVANTGPMLSNALVTTFVEPFQRGGQRVRDSDHGGVGLGLAIVAKIVRAHGGRLALTARSGGGLNVQVDLPVGGPRIGRPAY